MNAKMTPTRKHERCALCRKRAEPFTALMHGLCIPCAAQIAVESMRGQRK